MIDYRIILPESPPASPRPLPVDSNSPALPPATKRTGDAAKPVISQQPKPSSAPPKQQRRPHVSPPQKPTTPSEDLFDPPAMANSNHDSPFDTTRGPDLTEMNSNASAVATQAAQQKPTAQPALNISFTRTTETPFKKFVVTLKSGQRFEVTCLSTVPDDFEENFKTVLEDNYDANKKALSKPFLVKKGQEPDAIIFQPESETEISRCPMVKSKEFCEYIQSKNIKEFVEDEYRNYYSKVSPQPDSNTLKTDHSKKEETQPSAKVSATISNSSKGKSEKPKETPTPHKSHATNANNQATPADGVVIKQDNHTDCYLATFLQAHVLRKNKLPKLIQDLEQQIQNFDAEERDLKSQVQSLSAAKTQADQLTDPNSQFQSKQLGENLKAAKHNLENLKMRRKVNPKLLDYLKSLQNKKELGKEEMSQLFAILSEATNNQQFTTSWFTNSRQTRRNQQGDAAEVFAVISNLVYPNISKSPFLVITQYTRKPTPNSPEQQSTSKDSGIDIPIPEDVRSKTAISLKSLYLPSLKGRAGQQGDATVTVPKSTEYLTVNIKRNWEGGKFNGNIFDIPGLDKSAPYIAPIGDRELETIVCHQGEHFNSGHYYILEKRENGRWARIDSLSGNSEISLQEARELAHKEAVQLIYKKKN